MSRHFKVHELLEEKELEELRGFAREPGRTIDALHEWLLSRGYTLSRGAVGNWKQGFDGELLEERFRRSGDFASSLVSAAKEAGAVAVADAALLQLTQVVFEQSVRLQAEGELDPLDVMRWTRSLKNLTGTKKDVEQLIADRFDKEMKSRQEKRGGVITADDLAEARRAIFG